MSVKDTGWVLVPKGCAQREVGDATMLVVPSGDYSGHWLADMPIRNGQQAAYSGRADSFDAAKRAAESAIREHLRGMLDAMGDE